MFKKVIGLVLSVVMAVSVLGGCGKTVENVENNTSVSSTASSVTSDVTNEFVKLQMVMPDEMSKRMEEFTKNEFKTKLKEELNTEIEYTYIPMSNMEEKLNLMMAAQQELDLLWSGAGNVAKFAAKNFLLPVDESLGKYGQDIKRIHPPENFKSVTIDSKIYGIPTALTPSAEKFKTVLVRQDLLEEVGMNEIKSIEDLEIFYDKAKSKYPDLAGGISELFSGTTGPWFYFRTITDRDVNYVSGTYSIVNEKDNDDKIYSLYESEEFKKWCEIAQRWKAKGIIPDSLLTNPSDADAKWKAGKILFRIGAISRPMEEINNIKKNVPTAKLEEYLLSPERPMYKKDLANEMICIPSYSKRADRSTMFVNWMMKSAENQNFAVYGVEGKDYKLNNGRIEFINMDTLFPEWMFRNVNYMKFPADVSDRFIEKFTEWDKSAKLSKIAGFAFNSESVKAENAKVKSIVDTKVKILSYGFGNYNEDMPAVLKDLKDAGLDKIVSEAQKQYSEWRATNK